MSFLAQKSACGMPAQTKIAFKHISEYSRPKLDQITRQNIYFYMKNHENTQNSIKNTTNKWQFKAWLGSGDACTCLGKAFSYFGSQNTP